MPTKKHRLLLGAHMSIAGGFDKAIERGESINCTAIQIFSKSNRSWHANPITHEDALAFQNALKNSSIQDVVVHASYLINIASCVTSLNHQSRDALKKELLRCNELGIPYLVLHPGSAVGCSAQDGIAQVAEALDAVLSEVPGETAILLENMAGQGSSIGSTFEQLAAIYEKITHKKRVGIAFDTCHAFAAGYDFTTEAKYEKMWHHFDQTLGLSLLKAIHINDSKKECGSKVDRHEDIGKGKLGQEPFKLLFNDPRFFDIPKILETPRAELSDYARNMEVLRSLISPGTKKKLGMDDSL